MAGEVIKVEGLENGPVLIKTEEGDVVALCRCGHSKSGSFCDGTHKNISFKSEPFFLNLSDITIVVT